MNIRMISNRVLVKPDEPEAKIGNVILPEAAQAKSMRGTVLAVGPGKTRDDGTLVPVEVAVGDRVLLREFSGQEVVVGPEKYYIVFGHEILAVLE